MRRGRSFAGAARWVRASGCGALLALLTAAPACRRSIAPDGGIDAASAGCDGPGCAEGPSCRADSECAADSHCHCGDGSRDLGACSGRCERWSLAQPGFDPGCHRPPAFPIAELALAQRCRWTDGDDSPVLNTPLVLDLDGDGAPEVLFSTSAHEDQVRLVAIHGADCSMVWERPIVHHGGASLAAADLDGDGHPEIVLTTGDPPTLAVLDARGGVLARDDRPLALDVAPAIADVDGDGVPEIAVLGSVYRYHRGQPRLEPLFQTPVDTSMHLGATTTFADVDGDGRAELIANAAILDGLTGADRTPAGLRNYQQPSYPALADFNRDGRPDLVLVQPLEGAYSLLVFDLARGKLLFGPYYRPLPRSFVPSVDGGPPAIDDLDGDGVPEIVVAAQDSLCAFALRCVGDAPPPDCRGGPRTGALWCTPTQDFSSGVSAASTFDLNGDGIPEVIYRDECWLRIIDGPTGRTLLARAMTSGTAEEYPVVADLDRDGHADLIVTSDDRQPLDWCSGHRDPGTGAPWTGATSGVYLLRDPQNRWVPARSLWTSHAYHISEIGDDLKVPRHEPPSWLARNSFRTNDGPTGTRLADLTPAPSPHADNPVDCTLAFRLRATICNRGSIPVPAPVSGAFYAADPTVGTPPALCRASSLDALDPGACVPVFCDWPHPPIGSPDLWFRVDDDGRRARIVDQCRTDNDLLFLPSQFCQSPTG